MNFPTLPHNEPACYGLCCNRRGKCQRYHAVEGDTNPAQIVMDWCGPTGAEFTPMAAEPETQEPACLAPR